MKPAPFAYLRAESTREALEGLSVPDARILAGGQTLLPMLAMRLATPALLVDISRCSELDFQNIEEDRLCIGAATTQRALEQRATLAEEVPLLKRALPWVAHTQIRNRGTVCGSIAHADPAAEIPLCLVAAGGEVVLRSRRGTRTVGAAAFFSGLLQTTREADEMIIAARFPLGKRGERFGFAEFSMRHGDFAIVSAAAVVSDQRTTLAIGGVGEIPRSVNWPALTGGDLDDAINDFAWGLDAQTDTHASARYRRHLVRTLGRRVIIEAT